VAVLEGADGVNTIPSRRVAERTMVSVVTDSAETPKVTGFFSVTGSCIEVAPSVGEVDSQVRGFPVLAGTSLNKPVSCRSALRVRCHRFA